MTKDEIYKMRGGKKHNFNYFLGISETAERDDLTNIMRGKLRNQMGSQISGWYTAGFEPFEIIYGKADLDLKTMEIWVPRLKLSPEGRLNPTPTLRIERERKPACVLCPSQHMEAFHIMAAAANVFDLQHRIRCHAASSRAKLDLVLSYMSYPGRLPLCPDPADRFEAYLCLRSPEFLRDLLDRLDMPDSPDRLPEPELPGAA